MPTTDMMDSIRNHFPGSHVLAWRELPWRMHLQDLLAQGMTLDAQDPHLRELLMKVRGHIEILEYEQIVFPTTAKLDKECLDQAQACLHHLQNLIGLHEARAVETALEVSTAAVLSPTRRQGRL